MIFARRGIRRSEGAGAAQMDKVWPFFTGVIIDAELEGTEIPSSICLAVTQTDRLTVGQNRTEERRGEKRPLEWSGTAGSHGRRRRRGKKSGIADGRASH